MFGNFGAQEIILILLVLLLLFGAKKIPELARGLGRGIHEFKRAVREGEESLNPDESKKINPGG
ncbi:MAG TPA: twin-arginine translocase TatA/TatE family subunit [candidate division Zixibacteria bacterium]|nr:twin-arginine translocase TatA/TatE family subunit [candidate division Zixibacteria bacterium]